MAGPFLESSPPSKEPRFQTSALMALDDTAPYQWPSNCGLSIPRQDQESSGYSASQHLDFSPESAAMFDYASNSLPYAANYDLTYQSLQPGPSCPRSHSSAVTGLLDMPLDVGNPAESYPPSAYLLEPQKPQDIMDFADPLTSVPSLEVPRDYHHQSLVKSERGDHYDLLDYDPRSNALITSAPRDDPPLLMGESTRTEPCLEENAESKEQPYAQLIYRALMEAPGHTMILRDIYNWFKENTDKAADKETKGWQNSIRHNLSMNGVCLSSLGVNVIADTTRHLRKSINLVKIPKRGSCGVLPRRQFVKGSSRPRGIVASCPTNETSGPSTRRHNDKHLEPRVVRLLKRLPPGYVVPNV